MKICQHLILLLLFFQFPSMIYGLRWKVNDNNITNFNFVESFAFFGNKEEIKQFYSTFQPMLGKERLDDCNANNYAFVIKKIFFYKIFLIKNKY